MDHTVNPPAHDNAEQHDQVYQTTQYFNLPPGAEIAYPHPPVPFPQAESFWQGLFAQPTTEMPISTPPSYFHSQGEGSGTSPYAPDFPNQTLPLSYPNPQQGRRNSSHQYRFRPTSGPGSNVHRSRPSAHHSRVSQPYPQRPNLETPSGGRVPVVADPYAGPSQLIPTISNFESEIIQPGPSLAPQSASFVTHSIPYSQAPGPATSIFPRRYSEADVFHRKNVFPDPQAFVNQPTSTAYSQVPEYPAFPLAASNTQYLASRPITTIQETPSHPQDNHTPHVDPNFIPPSPSYESLDDSSSATSPGPSGGAGHAAQQGTASGSQQKRRRPGERKRAVNPKDKKAADRLRNQRETEDTNIEILYRIFVSRGGDIIPKKDRLDRIVQSALKFVENVGDLSPEQLQMIIRHGINHLPSQSGDTHNEHPQTSGAAEQAPSSTQGQVSTRFVSMNEWDREPDLA
ncbi:hypothetical protein BC827DRAFT_1186758 [Russula dissimulans]|nr:hypothetical protein BC827DRAFT_1186758 [Russula dissimulans]